MRHKIALVLAVMSSLSSGYGETSESTRPFTLADEIGLAEFGDPSHTGKVQEITLSPDGRWVAVHVGRGSLSDNKMESELRIYSVDALRHFANDRQNVGPPRSSWSIREATFKEGPIIQNIRWTANSEALAFLLKTPADRLQLIYADTSNKSLTPMSGEDQDVTAFDVVDRTHFVYTIRDASARRSAVDFASPAVAVTGRDLLELFFPATSARFSERSQLWAADDVNAAPVKDPETGMPLILFNEGLRSLKLSPDGRTILTAKALAEVPEDWGRQFPPSTATSPHRIVSGLQDLNVRDGYYLVSQYVLINSRNGSTITIVGAPTGSSSGWWPQSSPAWSAQGNAVLLPSTFLPAHAGQRDFAPPCIAVFELATHTTHCVESMTGRYTSNGLPNLQAASVVSLRFGDSFGRKVNIGFQTSAGMRGFRQYARAPDDEWRLKATSATERNSALDVVVKQSYHEPPVLIATDLRTQASRVVWDPNPQLKQIALGQVTVLHWRDPGGREWSGGLYKPADYHAEIRYPLVIQTHNFDEGLFRPSGLYPTGYAARALAASGILVLQTRCKTLAVTPIEGPCQAAGYESAVSLLTDQRLIDPERIGIIGFSRTCYYVLEALTRSALHFKAATITDGVNEGYWQYLSAVDFPGDAIAKEAELMNDGQPFGDGLQRWLKNAPTFNMEKVTAAMQIVGEGMPSLMSMWEPYALMRYQNKPVDLILLNTNEHVLTTPAMRMASQGGTVDWMRFWLQGYEDPDPAKTEQYRRWRELRKLEQTQDAERAKSMAESSTIH